MLAFSSASQPLKAPAPILTTPPPISTAVTGTPPSAGSSQGRKLSLISAPSKTARSAMTPSESRPLRLIFSSPLALSSTATTSMSVAKALPGPPPTETWPTGQMLSAAATSSAV